MTQAPAMPFPAHAQSVVRSLRGAFSELLTSLGVDPNEPQAVSRQLGLNKNLAWKICKIIQSTDPAVVFQQMPGASGLKILLHSTEQAGADPAILQITRDAINDYERLIRVHSGDRATLEILGRTLSSGNQRQTDEHHRKLLYQGASYVWGAQARCHLKLGVVGPSEKPGMLDFASVNGAIEFRRLRPDVTWTMAARSSINDDGTAMSTAATEAIDERFATADRAPLMGDFCSQPLPELRRFADDMLIRYELVEGPIGNTGALTCVAGTIQRDVPYYRTETNVWGIHIARCDLPAELQIIDLYFHRSFTFAIPPEPVLYSVQALNLPEDKRARYRLPLSEPLQDLGIGPLAPATPEVPRYSQLLRTVFGRMGWEQEEFHGFRMRLVYPPYPTGLVLRYRLPAPPDDPDDPGSA